MKHRLALMIVVDPHHLFQQAEVITAVGAHGAMGRTALSYTVGGLQTTMRLCRS